MQSYKKLSAPEKRKFWCDHIKAWKKSGQSQTEYCRNQKIKKSTLGYWITRLSRENGLVEVPVNLSPAHEVEIIINKTIRIQLSKGYSPALVTQLLQALGGICHVR